MRKIIILLTVWAGFGFVFAWSDRQSYNEKAELFRKKEALLQLVPSGGRIIISGGSNIFWGISSKTLQETVNRPVINLSIPSEIEDPELMRSLTLKLAKAGDVVVYSSMSFWLKLDVDLKRATEIAAKLKDRQYLQKHFRSFDHLASWWRPYPSEVNPVTAALRLLWNGPSLDTWSNYMDSHGDYQACSDINVGPVPFAVHADPSSFINEMQEFKQLLKEKGVMLVSTAPWILVAPEEKMLWKDYYNKMMASIKPFNANFSLEHPDMVLRLNQDEFCDCAWHLKSNMGIERTRLYIREQIEEELAIGFTERDEQTIDRFNQRVKFEEQDLEDMAKV